MDSTTPWVEAAAKGGPAGEIKIRECLVAALTRLGITVDVAGSDAEFERLAGADAAARYAFVVVDPWTWAGRG
ncbi:unnamed protein product, partial [Phaeothamnion confervicola]